MVVPIHTALINIFGLTKAKDIFENCFDPDMSYLYNRVVLHIVKFDKEIQTPEDTSMKDYLITICGGESNQNYKAIIKALLVDTKEKDD